jgi:hypothetical protein
LSGFIVQEIRDWRRVKDCPTKGYPADYPDLLPDLTPIDPPDETFWEAWEVVASGSFFNSVQDLIADQGGGPGTYGYTRTAGEVRFYEMDSRDGVKGIGDLDFDPTWGRGLVKTSGRLQLSTRKRPWFWDNPPSDGPSFKLTGADWHCCKKCDFTFPFSIPGFRR